MEILFIFPGFILAIIIVAICEIKPRKPQNRVRFFVICEKREMPDRLSYTLYLKTPTLNVEREWGAKRFGSLIARDANLRWFNLHLTDFRDMEDGEVREVFLNLED